MESIAFHGFPPPGHRAVLFDMDGVLIDSYHAHWQTWRRTGAARGFDITEAMFAATFGRGNREVIPLYGGKDYTDEQIRAWGDEKEDLFQRELIAAFPAMPGVSRFIRDLHLDGWQLGIGSSGFRSNVEIVRNLLPEGWRFRTMVAYQDLKRGKPDPEVFWRCAAGLGVSPARCVVVEDSLPGIAAARAAGMKVLAITGTTPREALEAAADRVVDRYDEVAPADCARLLD